MSKMSITAAALLMAVFVSPLAFAQDAEGWFPWQTKEDFSPSVIDTSDWLDKPAGKHGWLRMKGDGLQFEDGTPVKFWGAVAGLNSGLVDRPEYSEKAAKRWAKYGLNCVRLHKFSGASSAPGEPHTATDLDRDRYAKLDKLTAECKKNGVYYTWSHIAWLAIGPDDKPNLLAYDELRANGNDTVGITNFAKDVGDLQIKLTVNMLNHKNAVTGVKYADEPALAYIELQNEDDIFFGVMFNKVKKCPTYKKLLCEMFSDWLKARYTDAAGLEKAWGATALNSYPDLQAGESLGARNILPIAHSWWFSPDGMQQARDKGTFRRMMDTAMFLHETQNAYYARYIKAIRDTGYKGGIVGSCWGAGGVGRYYNLYSDYRAGIIDRHNYFGGSSHRINPGDVNARSMLATPGADLLSTGFDQCAGRPFAISEWISMMPNQWVAEGQPIIAAYGMGLQGWDASFCSASLVSDFVPSQTSIVVYNIDVPNQITQYPALGRMIYRGDVKEGQVVATRKVTREGLAENKFPAETLKQSGDVKEIAGEVPAAALAIGKVIIAFADKGEPSTEVDLGDFWDKDKKIVRSGTGQLVWDYSDKGFITINTPGTQGVAGFAAGKDHALSDAAISPQTPFAVILLSSLDRLQPIKEAKSLLVTAVARNRNTGMKYSDDGAKLTSVGNGPILVEPVVATIKLARPGKPTVIALDHDGRKTDKTVPVEVSGQTASFRIDGQYKAVYYEVLYP